MPYNAKVLKVGKVVFDHVQKTHNLKRRESKHPFSGIDTAKVSGLYWREGGAVILLALPETFCTEFARLQKVRLCGQSQFKL